MDNNTTPPIGLDINPDLITTQTGIPTSTVTTPGITLPVDQGVIDITPDEGVLPVTPPVISGSGHLSDILPSSTPVAAADPLPEPTPVLTPSPMEPVSPVVPTVPTAPTAPANNPSPFAEDPSTVQLGK